tara:strand:+ start:1475 stop:2005 length:531 start_codon:yes stop_codon:yes gene_type:complete
MDASRDDVTRYVSTMQDVASALGVNRHTVKEWLAEGAPGKGPEGYDVEAILTWRTISKSSTSSSIEGIDDDGQGPEEWKFRKLIAEAREKEAKAKIAEFEAQKTTEDVVHLDDVERFLSLVFAEARRVLKRIPKEMKPGYAEDLREAIGQDLDDRLDIALRTLSGYCRRVTRMREE